MTPGRRWPAALWPLLLLALFAATFRHLTPNEEPGTATLGCAGGAAGEVDTPSASFGISELEQCLTLEPRNVEVMADLARAYVASGQSGRAEAAYERALAIDPRRSDLHVRLGAVKLDRGDHVGARHEGELALQSRPNSLAARRLVARATAPPEGTP